MPPPVIMLFQRDLRLADNPALVAAAAEGPVLALFVLDDEAPGPWRPGGASRWWLERSLAALASDLAEAGSPLVLERGRLTEIVPRIADETGARAVHVARSYEPWAREQEDALSAALADSGIALRRFAGSLLYEPDAIATKAGTPFSVFTPFWRALLAQGPPRQPRRSPAALTSPGSRPHGRPLAALELGPRPDWAAGLAAEWQPGERGARLRLERFLKTAVGRYGVDRDRPDLEATSRLSPHLAFGEISATACWHAATARAAAHPETAVGTERFLMELAWREFSHHLLFHRPGLPETPLRSEFARFPWLDDAGALAAWQRGQTGIPMVDAGMRQLWQTGWMHNRVRMIAASFLVKNLLQPWQQGEAWFWDTLVDANLANNAASWQWVAGSGADAAPYFRIFNPVTQAERFDPDGSYVRRFVPELAGLPAPAIHQPWTADPKDLAAAGIVLGRTYPTPITDLKVSRQRALDAFAALRQDR
jgi:deoxyribodipyrimidine photo-lyase